jgi:type I restriction-modification system DNA methylase subunit
MTALRLPSLEIPEAEKYLYTEADVHSTLFELDLAFLGYPLRTSSQADGDHFLEQRALAVRRLKSRVDRTQRGHFDGLYLVGNAPVVLCEVKRYNGLDTDSALADAVRQLTEYARSEDFEKAPPFLLLYCGKPDRTRFYRRRPMLDDTAAGQVEYERLPEIWTWERIKEAHVKGAFAQEVVDRGRLLEILLHHLDRIEDDLRAGVTHAVQLAAADELPAVLPEFGRWLRENPEALRRVRELYQRKVAEVGKGNQRQVVEEMVTQAALNYLNKVFFLNFCEDRNLPGFERILREFLPTTRAETKPTTASVFLGLLRRKIRDVTDWRVEEEQAYRALRGELISDIREHVIEQNNWWQLIRVAFDLAEERFPLVYREDAYDYFRPGKETLAELVYDLSTKSFEALTNRHVGDIYQGLLSSRRRGATDRSSRQAHQSKLGAFYTPREDVDYMVSRLELTRESRVLDPCMGSGHFLEGLYEALLERYTEQGYSDADAYRQIVGGQVFGGDIDTFATSLAAIRLFLLDEHGTGALPNLYVHDMLLHSPERPGAELFSPEVLEAEGRERSTAERAVSSDPEVDALAAIDEIEFDAIVGNPPYGAKKPKYKEPVYARLYGQRDRDRRVGSVATGAGDTYAMFFANAIERLREGGRLCLITNDSFRSLTSHGALRRHILGRCKIVEILLTDAKHFEGVSFAFAGMAITTLEKCSDAEARRANTMRLVDYIREPAGFASPPAGKVSELRQEEYETLPDTPFFVGVPREVFVAARDSLRVRDVARGRVGLQTSEDSRFLAGVGRPAPGVPHVVEAADLATTPSEDERSNGIPLSKAHWVPFAKGEGYGEYWREPGVAIDWSQDSVAELRRRADRAATAPRKAYIRNDGHYFHAGLTYSVISGGRLSVRLLPEGWIFGHKGSAIFTEDAETSEAFLLGYLNSSLATYFMKKIVNTTATADIGYVERLPYRKPSSETEKLVVDRVRTIVAALKADGDADIASLRDEIDDAIFDLFEIHAARAEVRRFYTTIGLVEVAPETTQEAASGQAATASP